MEKHDQFEYINEGSIDEDLLCPLCTDPLTEPFSARQCGHTFCRQCITNTFQTMDQCPTCRQTLNLDDFHPVNIRPFLNQLNQLLIQCKLCSATNIQRGNFNDHLKACENAGVTCPAADIDCDWKGKRDDLEEHVRTCALVKVQPKINELNNLVKQQSEQIAFLFTILNKVSDCQKDALLKRTIRRNRVSCDACDMQFTSEDYQQGLHFDPDADFCVKCIKKHFKQ